MGRWPSALREREKNSEMARMGGDKTDKTSPSRVLSVLSVPVGSVCEKAPEDFAGAPCWPLPDAQPSSMQPAVSPEDWWAYFNERAVIREFDGKTLRFEAEVLALQDTVAVLEHFPLRLHHSMQRRSSLHTRCRSDQNHQSHPDDDGHFSRPRPERCTGVAGRASVNSDHSNEHIWERQKMHRECENVRQAEHEPGERADGRRDVESCPPEDRVFPKGTRQGDLPVPERKHG